MSVNCKLESIRNKVNTVFFQGNITPLVLRVKVNKETRRQDTIPRLRHGNNRSKSRNVKLSKWSSAVVFNAKWLCGWGGGGYLAAV